MKNNFCIIDALFQRAIKMRYIVAILLIWLWAYQGIFWNVINSKETNDLFKLCFYVLNDRFILLLVHAIGYLFLYSKVVNVLRDNDYIVIRLENKKKVQSYTHKMFVLIVISGIVVSMLMLGIIIVTSRIEFYITKEWAMAFVIGLFCSILYYFMLGVLYSVMDLLLKRKNFVMISLSVILLLNVAVSSNTAFSSKKFAKFTFIGNLIDISSQWWMSVLYWSILICILLFCERYMILHKESIKVKLFLKHRTYLNVAILSVLSFFILGIVSISNHDIYKENVLENLTQELMGFAVVNQYMFMYLLYQLPILIFLFYRMTKHFSVYAFQYALRKGSIWRWQKQQILETINWIVIFYMIGIVVLCIINYVGGGIHEVDSFNYESVEMIDVLVQIINCVLQSICLLFTSFLFWLLETGEKSIGFIITLFWHLIATVLACAIPNLGYILPLTQGQPYAQKSTLYALLYQCIWFLGIVLCTKKLLDSNQDMIIMRKMKE